MKQKLMLLVSVLFALLGVVDASAMTAMAVIVDEGDGSKGDGSEGEGAEVGEPAEEEVAPQKGSKEIFLANIKSKVGKEDMTEDEVYEASMNGYDDVKGELSSMKKSNEDVIQRLQENPEAAEFVQGLINNEVPADVLNFLMENYDDFDQEDENFKSFNSNKTKRRERDAEMEKIQSEFMSNLDASMEEINKFSETEGMTEEEVAALLGEVTEKLRPIMEGNLTAQDLTSLKIFANMEEEMKASEEAGKVQGRNEKIVEKKKLNIGDELPELKSTAGDQGSKVTKASFGRIVPKKDAFEVGGYPQK